MKGSQKRKLLRLTHTVVGKNVCLMLLFGTVMLLFVLFSPSLFYELTKEELTEQIANSIREETVRIGFLLTNHRPVGRLSGNEEYIELIRSFYHAEEEEKTNLQIEIEKRMQTYEEGKKQWDKNSIGNTNYYFMMTEQGDLFCQDDVRPIAEAVAASEWFRESETQYSTVMTFAFEQKKEQYFCYRTEYEAEGVSGTFVHVALFQDYIDQLERMQEEGIEDFLLVNGTEILYQNLADSKLNTDASAYYEFGNSQYEVIKEEKEDAFIFTALCSLNTEELYLIVRMTRDEIMIPFQPFFRIMRIFVTIIILTMMLVSCVIVSFSLHRLTRLGKEMAKIGNGTTEFTLKDDHDDEVGEIIRTTNVMLSQLRQNTEERVQHEKEEKRMQYVLMISAVDPHFIYNTLDTISFLAAMGKNKDVVKMNDALIATLKDRLQMKAYKIFDTVKVEVQVIQNYMLIQSYLCSDRIACEFEVEPETEQLMIPKNILQPLVENSIKHGLMTNKDSSGLKILEGRIVVRVAREGERIKIVVSDNGSGMSEELKEHYLKTTYSKDGSTEHLGLLNMKGRLAYLYHEDYSFDIQSTPGQGTDIQIIIPIVKREEKDNKKSFT